jgi:hypothetical protein
MKKGREDNIKMDLKEIPATLRARVSWLGIRLKMVIIRLQHFCCTFTVMPPTAHAVLIGCIPSG